MKRLRWWILVPLILLIILGQFSFTNPAKDKIRIWFSYPTRAITNASHYVENLWQIAHSINHLAQENSTLKAQNSELLAEVANLKSAKSENEQLREDLKFAASRPDFNLKAANVLGFSPTNLYQAFTIDMGEKDGIRLGQAVLSSGYLIGKVSKLSSETAEVWLLSNRSLVTPVQLPQTRTIGILRGGIRGLTVSDIPLDTKVSNGEPIVTSSLEGLYPAGIPIGTINRITSAKEDIFLTLLVSSPINVGSLSTVFVVEAGR